MNQHQFFRVHSMSLPVCFGLIVMFMVAMGTYSSLSAHGMSSRDDLMLLASSECLEYHPMTLDSAKAGELSPEDSLKIIKDKVWGSWTGNLVLTFSADMDQWATGTMAREIERYTAQDWKVQSAIGLGLAWKVYPRVNAWKHWGFGALMQFDYVYRLEKTLSESIMASNNPQTSKNVASWRSFGLHLSLLSEYHLFTTDESSPFAAINVGYMDYMSTEDKAAGTMVSQSLKEHTPDTRASGLTWEVRMGYRWLFGVTKEKLRENGGFASISAGVFARTFYLPGYAPERVSDAVIMPQGSLTKVGIFWEFGFGK